MSLQMETEHKTLYWQMYRALVGVTTLCGIIIVLVYLYVSPVIETNKEIALAKAIVQILPKATKIKTYYLDKTGQFVERSNEPMVTNVTLDGGEVIYAGYDNQQQLVGLVIPAQGMGYQDTIKIIYAYDLMHQAIIGMFVLESRETPGLGSRIADDPVFLKNFKWLDVALNEAQIALMNPITMVKSGKKNRAWQIDSITGATVSSYAVGKIIRKSTRHWLPILKAHQEVFFYGD